MFIYIILSLIIIVLAIVLKDKRFKYNGKKIYCIFIGIILLIIMGLRNTSMGQYDVQYSYVPMFNNIINMNFKDILSSGMNDTLFHLIMKIFSIIWPNVHGWIFFLSFLFVGSVTTLIYFESKIPSLSFVLFLGLNYYGYNFTILRHSIALSMIIITYLFYKKNKKVLSFISFVLAGMFHITAFVFIIAILFIKQGNKYINFAVIFISFIICKFMGDSVIDFMFNTLTIERFTRYENHIERFNFTMFFITLSIWILSYINLKSAQKKNENINFLFNMCTISIVFLSFSTVFALFFRVSMFFGIFNIILLPNTLNYDRYKIRRICIYIVTTIVFLIYFLTIGINNAWINPYRFFWN